MSNSITTDWLNLRKEPVIFKDNIITVLPPGTIVEKDTANSNDKWSEIKTQIGNNELEGYVATQYLEDTDKPLAIPAAGGAVIPRVHLLPSAGMVISRNNTARAYPLNEAGLYRIPLVAGIGGQGGINAVNGALDYLDVEHSLRYAPSSTQTYCNIYAYDVAYCLSGENGSGPYVPRVWWNENALADIKEGKIPDVIYAKTVNELNANALTDWFENYGTMFNWEKCSDITVLQEKVNAGTLGIIVGQRINLNNSGHIVSVIPETANHQAQRSEGKVLSPLQSQAGSVNKKYTTGNNWWLNQNRFRKFGFWVYDIQ